MRAIIGYAVNMLPYMLLAVPVYLAARAIFLKTKKIKSNRYHEAALFLFVLFAVGLASQTVIPKLEFGVNGFGIAQGRVHKTNLIPFLVLAETWQEVFEKGNINYFLINFLGNIVMFLPFGLCIPLLWRVPGRKTMLIGFCTSLLIELSQLFLARGTDVDDLLLNTAGVLLGLLLYRLLHKRCGSFTEKFKIM